MCVDASVPYSACLSIEDPVALLKTIIGHGEILTTKAAVRTIFKDAAYGAVTYEAVTQDIRTGPVIIPSPFKKATVFAPQREHRMLFVPRADIPQDTIIIKIPEPAKHFHEVFRGV
jgi:hypothetical protein